MKIAIITISTGSYNKFLSDLYESINKFFLPKHDRHFFLFSDVQHELWNTFIKIDALPKPLNTLLKFHYFNKLSLDEFDLIYFFDSDSVVVDMINDEVIPDYPGEIIAVEHPWQGKDSTIYERNILSTACVTDNKRIHYFQSCFFGGFADDFCKMSKQLEINTNIDLKNNIIPIWREESQFNRYCINNPIKALNMAYAYPDFKIWNQTFNILPKIVHFNYSSVA